MSIFLWARKGVLLQFFPEVAYRVIPSTTGKAAPRVNFLPGAMYMPGKRHLRSYLRFFTRFPKPFLL